ncbi:phosphonate metabolism transcriptional regulator PhnF [Labrys sp. LIt4]|uniref:Phosphonate metabolism transcriptional regulator PhnF n=1 Tax=Labrys okinawensis TaxID=346911 RepID=A0A2S9QF30_9HYPH|nr:MULTISPECIES: phosphonate metabolism transcriptional regulator PhnF [Labrys]MBP0578192.1 phosphonate metabolism transcriptional regulator PhnF [Labrys sp. LIt4]PRH87951.1 phosphonate metabolism transcriptional regulator PhnF [Labrys okinawensis]
MDGAVFRGDGIAAWRKIADLLEAEIVGGMLAPGTQLPTEAALAARFGVNRHTVRRALGELAGKGLVRTAQGRGTFVELSRLAYPIGERTRFSQNMAQEGREAGGIVLEAVEIEADPRLAGLLDIAPGSPVLRLLTLRSADDVPIAFGSSYFPLPRFAGFAEAYRRLGAVTPALAACGVDDYKRQATRVGARFASPEEAARLDIAVGRPLLTVESVNVDLDGIPIQATFGLFAADRTEIVLQS